MSQDCSLLPPGSQQQGGLVKRAVQGSWGKVPRERWLIPWGAILGKWLAAQQRKHLFTVMPVPGGGGCSQVGGLCLSLSCQRFILLILVARSLIAFCWPCRVSMISAIIKAREGDDCCSEEAISWDDTTQERGAEIFSSSSAQQMASFHTSRKEMLGWLHINFRNSFLSNESWTFYKKWSLSALSLSHILSCFFRILACR